MIDISGRLSTLTINPGRFTKTLDEAMEVQLRQAARQWLRAVIVNVPIWTGMSMGSLKPLGSFLKVKVPDGPIVEKNRPGRNFAEGKKHGDFQFSKRGTEYFFEFDESVPSFVINEYFNVSPPLHLRTPGPWNAFKAGEFAFQNYVQRELPQQLPKLEDILETKKVELY